MNHAEEVSAFKERKFSGMDLLMIMEHVGIGVGATMHVVKEIEYEQNRPNSTYRKWTYEENR